MYVRVLDNVLGFVGYSVLFWNNVLRPGEQDFGLNGWASARIPDAAADHFLDCVGHEPVLSFSASAHALRMVGRWAAGSRMRGIATLISRS